MRLKRTQKNQLFDSIEQSGLSPAMFKLLENDNRTANKGRCSIKVVNQEYHFTFWEKDGNIEYLYSPSTDWFEVKGDATDFAELVDDMFLEWLAVLKEELTTEDKWANFNDIFKSLEIVNFSNEQNEKFSASEFADLKIKMEVLKNSLSDLNLDNKNLKLIEDKLDQVLNKAIELGKYDWRSLFIGTVISVILQLSLSQEQGKQLWELIKRVFSNYFLTE